MLTNNIIAKIAFLLSVLICAMPFTQPWMALIGGTVFALALGNPFQDRTKKLTPYFLAISIIGLGAGMNLADIWSAGVSGFGYTAISICLALVFGLGLGCMLKTSQNSSILVSVGTAICGGSAIAAIAPILKARHVEISIALAIVFALNALALLLFPMIGKSLGLTEIQFGLWSALAIHDISSVVGATLQYGPEALEVGTTVKLVRALWIVPLAIGFGFYISSREGSKENSPKIKIPWFIGGFVLMSAIMTWVPSLQPAGTIIEMAARHLLVVTLFLIGSALTKQAFQDVSLKPFIQGVLLWVIIAGLSLGAIMIGWIN